MNRRHFILASGASAVSTALPAARSIVRTPAFLRDLQQRTFRFFWDTTDPETGLAVDRWRAGKAAAIASIASIGFALTAYPVGVANGWITRAMAAKRTLATLRFLSSAPQGAGATGVTGYRGFFYHFLGMQTGTRFRTSELSTIDTALLLAGVLFAQSWYDDRDDAGEREIRALAEDLYRKVEWSWLAPNDPFIAMGWHPESGPIPHQWNGFNESLILYLLALGSPTHPIAADRWDRWTAAFDRSWVADGALSHTAFGPLFGHQYSQTWVDFRGMRDAYSRKRGLDYFENSRRATYAQRRYAIDNPAGFTGYGKDIWGLTACDGPGDFTIEIGGRKRSFQSYSARGAPDPDDGTIAPTAALGSIAFAPEIVVPAALALNARYGRAIYRGYGFVDSFNPTLTAPDAPIRTGHIVPGIGWVDSDHLGIDQGPILCMIENWRSGMIWRTMSRNPHIRRGLSRAGFAGGWMNGGA